VIVGKSKSVRVNKMQPIFTMQYGEFAVADYLSKKIKGTSVFIPTSAQEKGIDLLLYRYDNGCNKVNTIQVKMSRTYYVLVKLFCNSVLQRCTCKSSQLFHGLLYNEPLKA
jgi:hypothetical protein